MAKKVFGIDLRALAVFRIGLAAVIIMDLAQRASDLEAHYTDFGILDRTGVLQVLPKNFISLHLLNGTLFFQGVLFFIAFLFALFFLVGYHTRLSGFVSFILLTSLQNRNPLILNNADTLLLSLLFWGLFLPVHACFSIDSKKFKFLFSSFSVGILILMDIGFFAIINLVALIPFIPKECWDLAEKKLMKVQLFSSSKEQYTRETDSVAF